MKFLISRRTLRFRLEVLASLILFCGGGALHAQELNLTGNARQVRENGGLVKAMVFIHDNGTILRAFNSFLSGTAATTAPCGFSTAVAGNFNNGEFYYTIDFGFRVDDRFVSVTPSPAGFLYGVGGNPNKLQITSNGRNYFTVIVY